MTKSVIIYNTENNNSNDITNHYYILSQIDKIYNFNSNDLENIFDENQRFKKNKDFILKNKLHVPFLIKKVFEETEYNDNVIYTETDIFFQKENIEDYFNTDIYLFSNKEFNNRIIPFQFINFFNDDNLLDLTKKFLDKNIPSVSFMSIKKNNKNINLINEWLNTVNFFILNEMSGKKLTSTFNITESVLSILLIKNYDYLVKSKNWNDNLIEKSEIISRKKAIKHNNPTLYLQTYLDNINISIENLQNLLKSIVHQRYFPG